jgi:hypothetical protein
MMRNGRDATVFGAQEKGTFMTALGESRKKEEALCKYQMGIMVKE